VNTTKQETAEEKVKVTMERERQKEKNNLNHLLVHFRELVYQRNRLFLKKKREENTLNIESLLSRPKVKSQQFSTFFLKER